MNRLDSIRVVSTQAYSLARYLIGALVIADVNQKLMALTVQHLLAY